MSTSKANVSVNLCPPMFLLFLVFLVLKLCGVIAWSWWWVTAPLWIPVVLVIGITLIGLLIGLIGFGIAGLLAYWATEKRKKEVKSKNFHYTKRV